MRHLQPVEVVVDIDVPESGFWADESMFGPAWTSQEVVQTFFGHAKRQWAFEHIKQGHAVLDGEPVEIPRQAHTGHRYWRLVDVERFAHALAQNGYLEIGQLVRVIQQVKIIAQSWGFIEPDPIPTRIETYDPNRQGVRAMAEAEDRTDDLDGTPDAEPHVLVLDGVEYHLDLTRDHWHELIGTLVPYLNVARRNDRPNDDRHGPKKAEREAIRAWGRRHGYAVSDHGPLSQALQRAYHSRSTRHDRPA